MAAPCGKRGNRSFNNTNTNSNIFPSLQNCLQRVRYSSYSNTHNALEITKYKNNRFLKTLAVGSASIVGIVCGLKLKVKLSSTSTTNAAVSHPLSGADNNGSYQTFDKIECQNFKLSNAFKNLKLSSIWSMCANSMKSTSFQLPKLKVNAAAKENQLPVSANPSDFQSSGSLDKVPWHFHHPPTKKIRHGSTGGLAKLTLYQYVTCPFCCKVRAYLDFYGIDYDIIEVDSIRRTQKKWTSYKKVPVLVCDGAGPDGFLQLNDSSVIVSVLESHRLSSLQSKESTVTSPGLEKLVSYYPVLESKEGRKTVYEFPNKYFVMFGDGEIPKELSALREEREWREWVDNNLVHILSPNAYRTLPEAVQVCLLKCKVNYFHPIQEHLLCHLYDYDQFVKTEKVGVVQLRLNSLPHDESLYVGKHIDRCLPESHDHEENYVGELLFSVKSTKAKDNLTLTFFFAKAKDLHIEDEIAVLGLTVRVTVLEDGKKLKKKRTIDNIKVTTNPLFNQEIVLVLPQHVNLADMSIVVDLCKVKISSYEVVGRVYISADGDKRGAEHWRELQHSLNTNNKSLEWWHQLKKVAKGS
ncbi:Su(P) [Bugula neritina]|uniref:Su(P) n=1 Tax=Bugula neritina TaxID=10212 RepID=A0A7J7JIG1_BUGNE|nr:Su(P) [Bugula neritina]